MKLTQIETPALIIDRKAFEANMAAMRQLLKGTTMVLRPHYKSHKSVAVARLQLAAGAKGITTAKLSEAEDLAQAGVGMGGFKEEYWAVAESIFNYCTAQGMSNAFAMSYDSYALAGYIAGDLFCQGLAELEAQGKALTRANYIDVLESKEFQVAMADKISFANGMRAGVQSFALTAFYDAFTVNGGAYHSAASATVYGLTSIDEYRAILAN